MKVSVVMLVYDTEGTVLPTLDSPRTSTISELEIIIVNDGSTYGTVDILHRQKDLEILDHSHRGIAPALNDGQAAVSRTLLHPSHDWQPRRTEKIRSRLTLSYFIEGNDNLLIIHKHYCIFLLTRRHICHCLHCSSTARKNTRNFVIS